MSLKFSVKLCDKNQYRWYVSFHQTKPFTLPTIKDNLEQISYRTLATTPTVMVFRSEFARLTWHSYGLLQVDFNDKQIRNPDSVQKFVRALLEYIYPDSSAPELS